MAKLTNTSQNVINKAMKLLELANRGIDGERDNAQKLLKEYMKKHRLTLYDLGQKRQCTGREVTFTLSYSRSIFPMRYELAAQNEFLYGMVKSAWELVVNQVLSTFDKSECSIDEDNDFWIVCPDNMEQDIRAAIQLHAISCLDGIYEKALRYLRDNNLTPPTMRLTGNSMAKFYN